MPEKPEEPEKKPTDASESKPDSGLRASAVETVPVNDKRSPIERMQESLTVSSNCSPDVTAAYKTIEEQLKKIGELKEDSPEYRYLHSADPAEREKIREGLRVGAQSDDPDKASKSISALKTINFVEAATKLADTLDLQGPAAEDDRRDALRQLYGLRRSEPGDDGPAATVLESVASKEPIASDLSRAVMNKEWEQFVLDEQAGSQVERAFSGSADPGAAIKELSLLNKSELDQGNDRLAAAARCCQKLAPLFEDGGVKSPGGVPGIVECLNRWKDEPDKQSSAKEIGKVLETAGIVKRDEETGEYVAVAGAQVDFEKVRSGQLDAKTDQGADEHIQPDYLAEELRKLFETAEFGDAAGGEHTDSQVEQPAETGERGLSPLDQKIHEVTQKLAEDLHCSLEGGNKPDRASREQLAEQYKELNDLAKQLSEQTGKPVSAADLLNKELAAQDVPIRAVEHSLKSKPDHKVVTFHNEVDGQAEGKAVSAIFFKSEGDSAGGALEAKAEPVAEAKSESSEKEERPIGDQPTFKRDENGKLSEIELPAGEGKLVKTDKGWVHLDASGNQTKEGKVDGFSENVLKRNEDGSIKGEFEELETGTLRYDNQEGVMEYHKADGSKEIRDFNTYKREQFDAEGKSTGVEYWDGYGWRAAAKDQNGKDLVSTDPETGITKVQFEHQDGRPDSIERNAKTNELKVTFQGGASYSSDWDDRRQTYDDGNGKVVTLYQDAEGKWREPAKDEKGNDLVTKDPETGRVTVAFQPRNEQELKEMKEGRLSMQSVYDPATGEVTSKYANGAEVTMSRDNELTKIVHGNGGSTVVEQDKITLPNGTVLVRREHSPSEAAQPATAEQPREAPKDETKTEVRAGNWDIVENGKVVGSFDGNVSVNAEGSVVVTKDDGSVERIDGSGRSVVEKDGAPVEITEANGNKWKLEAGETAGEYKFTLEGNQKVSYVGKLELVPDGSVVIRTKDSAGHEIGVRRNKDDSTSIFDKSNVERERQFDDGAYIKRDEKGQPIEQRLHDGSMTSWNSKGELTYSKSASGEERHFVRDRESGRILSVTDQHGTVTDRADPKEKGVLRKVAADGNLGARSEYGLDGANKIERQWRLHRDAGGRVDSVTDDKGAVVAKLDPSDGKLKEWNAEKEEFGQPSSFSEFDSKPPAKTEADVTGFTITRLDGSMITARQGADGKDKLVEATRANSDRSQSTFKTGDGGREIEVERRFAGADGPYLKRDSQGCITETRDAYGNIRQFKYAENRKPGDQPLQVLEPGEPPKVIAERVEEAHGGKTRSVLREVVSEGPPKQYGVPCRYLADGAQERTMPPDKEKGLPETVRYQFLDGRQLVATGDGKLLWDYNPVLASKESEERIAAARSRWETEDLSAITSSSDLRSKADEAVAVYLDRNAFEGDREKAYEALKMLSQSEAGKEDKQLQETLANFQAIEMARQVLLSTLDPERTAEALESLHAYAKGEPPNAVAQQLLESIVGSDVNGSGYEAVLKALNEGGLSAKDAIEIILERLEPAVQSAADQQRLSLITKNVSSVSSVEDLNKANRALMQEAAQGNRQALDLAIVTREMIKSAEKRHAEASSSSAKLSFLPDGRVEQVQHGAVTSKFQYGSDGKTVRVMEINIPDIHKPGSIVSVSYELQGQGVVNPKTGELTVVAKVGGAGSLARTETVYSPDGSSKVTSYNDSGLRVEQVATTRNDQGEVQTLRTSYVRLDDNGSKTDGVLSGDSVVAVQRDASGAVVKEETFSSESDVESGRPQSSHQIDRSESSENESVERHTFSRTGSSGAEEVVATVSKTTNLQTGERTFTEEFKLRGEQRTVKLDGQSQPLELKRKIGDDTFEYQFKNGAIESVFRNGQPVGGAELDRLKQEGKAILELTRSERLIALTPTDSRKLSAEEPSQTDFQPGEPKSEGESPDGDAPAERPVAAQAPVDVAKLKQEIDELVDHADADTTNSSKVDMPDGQWRKFDRDESGRLLRISESNGTTWLSGDGKSFVNAGTGERREGEVRVSKDGSYKFVLAGDREIRRNTDNSETFSDSNGSVTINSDNSKLVRNSNGALVLIADAAGRVTRLEPTNRGAEDQPTRVTLPGGKVWERVGDKLWKQPDAIDPVTEQKVSGDTMNGDWAISTNGDVTLSSAKGKDSITFKVDGSVVSRNEEGRVVKVEDKFGRSQLFSYRNNELVGTQDYDGTRWSKVSDGVWAKEGSSQIWKGNRSIDADGTLRLTAPGRELIRRTDGWEEQRDTQTGKVTFHHKTPDNAIVVKNQGGQIIEMRFANGDFRKFDYDQNGAINKVTSKSGDVLTTTDGINWKNQSRPSEPARQVTFEVGANGLFREVSGDGKTEVVHKGDGSTILAVDGKIVEVTDPFGLTHKLKWDDAGNLTAVEQPAAGQAGHSDDGTVWRKTGDQTWQLETKSGTPVGPAVKAEFKVDGQGNILQKNWFGQELTTTIFRTSGEVEHVEAQLRESPQSNGARTFTNENGQIIKVVDTAGKVTEFGYDEQNRLISLKNDAGKFVSADGVNWKPEGPVAVGAARLVPGNGKYEVLKDGTVRETLADAESQRFYRTDGTTVVKDQQSVKTLDDKGRITETIDSSGGRTRFEYGTVERVVDGRTVKIPDQLSRVTHPNGVVLSTGDGLNWQGQDGSKWQGVVVLKKDGTLIKLDMEGKETRHTLDGKVAVAERKDILAKVDDAHKMLTEWFSDQSLWTDAAQAAELDKKFTGMPAAEVQIVFNMLARKLDASQPPDQLLKSYLGEGHHWEKVVGHLSRADEANFEKVAGDDAAAIRTALTERGQYTGDRSSEGCEKAIRLTLQKLTHEQIQQLSAEYQRRYGQSLQDALDENTYLSQFTRDSIVHYMKGSDQITPQERIDFMIKTCNSKVIDHFEESCLGTSQEERDKVIADNGGYDQIMLKLWNMYGGLSTRDWLHAREALLYGGQTEAQKIRDSVGIFSNDEANIEKVLKEMSSERREMFFRGEYLQTHQNEIKSDADKRAHSFYRNLAYAFDTMHYNANWNKGLRLEQMRDQVMVQGGGLIEKLGTHKGFWTDATKDVVATVHDMTRSDWDALVSDPKYMDRLDLHVGTAIGAENFAPIKQLLQSKLAFKDSLDQSDPKELKEKFDHFNKMSDSDLERYVAGRALAKDLQSKSIDENGRFDSFKLAKLEGELKTKAASGDEKAKKSLESLELYRNETYKAVKDGARRYVVDALGDTAGDAKAGIDIILEMTSEERKLYKASRIGFDLEGPVQTELHDKVKAVFGLDTPAYETAMRLLKQIRDGKDNQPPALTLVDKLNMLTYESSTKASDVVMAIETALKEDKALAEKIKSDPKFAAEFEKAAVRALANVHDAQRMFDGFIKPLVENGNLTADQLIKVHRIDPDLHISPERESINKHLLSMSPNALHRLNSNPGEKEKLLLAINPEDRKVVENLLLQSSALVDGRAKFLDSLSAADGQRQIVDKIIDQGGPKTSEEKAAIEKLPEGKRKELAELMASWKRGPASAADEMRLFVLGGGVDAQRVKSLLGDMDLSQKRQLLQEYASKYGLRDLKRDLVDYAESADRPQIEYLVRTSELSAGLKLNIAVYQATTSDGVSSSLMRYTGYGGTLTELRQDLFDMQSEVASANREKRPVDEKLIDELEASFRESLVNFRVAKEQFADSIVNTALTAAALASAPFTGGASLAPIFYGMAAGAALKLSAHYMVSGADFEMSVSNISRKITSGMVEGGFAMVNPSQLGPIVGLGRVAAGKATVLTVKELNALAGGLGAKALTEAGEQFLESEMKQLVGAALASRVAGVSEAELAALAQKVIAREFGQLAEAEAKQLAAKLTESLSKNLQQAIASETKTFLQQVHKEVFHQGANAFIGSGSAVAGTLVDQYFTGKFDGGALMQAGGEGAFGGLTGSAIGRSFHGIGQWRKIDDAAAPARLSFALLQAVSAGMGSDALTQTSLHGTFDLSWDTMFSTLLDAGSSAKDAGAHGGPPHPRRHTHGDHSSTRPHGADGRPAGDSPAHPSDHTSSGGDGPGAGDRTGPGHRDGDDEGGRPPRTDTDRTAVQERDTVHASTGDETEHYRNQLDGRVKPLREMLAGVPDTAEKSTLLALIAEIPDSAGKNQLKAHIEDLPDSPDKAILLKLVSEMPDSANKSQLNDLISQLPDPSNKDDLLDLVNELPDSKDKDKLLELVDNATATTDAEKVELQRQVCKLLKDTIVDSLKADVQKILKQYGMPTDLINISFDPATSDVSIDWTDPLEKMIGAQQDGGVTDGVYSWSSHKIRVDFSGTSPTTTLRHEIQHWYNAMQRTILANADPAGFETGIRESVKRQIGGGGQRLQDDGHGGNRQLVERLSLSQEGKEHLNALFDVALPIAEHGNKVPSEGTVKALLNDPKHKESVSALLKEMGGDTPENRERLVQELRGELSHHGRVLRSSTIPSEALPQDSPVRKYIEQQVARLREIKDRPVAVDDATLARRKLIDTFLKQRDAGAGPPTAQELQDWLATIPVYDPAINAIGDLATESGRMMQEIKHWSALMKIKQSGAEGGAGCDSADLAKFISENHPDYRSGEEYVRAMTKKYTTGASESYTGFESKQEYLVGREERTAKIAQHVYELRNQVRERSYDTSAEVLENLKVESRLAIIQSALERGSIDSKSAQRASEQLLQFLQEKNGDYYKSAEIAKLLVDSGLVSRDELERIGLGKLLPAVGASSVDAEQSVGDGPEAMHSERKVSKPHSAESEPSADANRPLSDREIEDILKSPARDFDSVKRLLGVAGDSNHKYCEDARKIIGEALLPNVKFSPDGQSIIVDTSTNLDGSTAGEIKMSRQQFEQLRSDYVTFMSMIGSAQRQNDPQSMALAMDYFKTHLAANLEQMGVSVAELPGRRGHKFDSAPKNWEINTEFATTQSLKNFLDSPDGRVLRDYLSRNGGTDIQRFLAGSADQNRTPSAMDRLRGATGAPAGHQPGRGGPPRHGAGGVPDGPLAPAIKEKLLAHILESPELRDDPGVKKLIANFDNRELALSVTYPPTGSDSESVNFAVFTAAEEITHLMQKLNNGPLSSEGRTLAKALGEGAFCPSPESVTSNWTSFGRKASDNVGYRSKEMDIALVFQGFGIDAGPDFMSEYDRQAVLKEAGEKLWPDKVRPEGEPESAEPGEQGGEKPRPGESSTELPHAGEANFRLPGVDASPSTPDAVLRAHTFEKVSAAELQREVARIGEQFSQTPRKFVETPQVVAPEFSGNLTGNQVIAKLKERGLKDADIFEVDANTGQRKLKITRDQFERLVGITGKPVEMVSFKVGGMEVEMTAELANVHEKVRELRKAVAAGEGSTSQQRQQYREAQSELKKYEKVILPEEVIARLRRTPDPRLCEKLVMLDKPSVADVWLTLKSSGENEGKWDSTFAAAGWANPVFRTIAITPESTRGSLDWVVRHEWSHLLESSDKRFRNVFEAATRVEKALGESDRYFHREYSTLNTSEDWATAVGEVFLNPDPSDFHAMVQSAKEGSSKTKVLVELAAAVHSAEVSERARSSHGRSGQDQGRFHDLQQLRDRFAYAKKELLGEARAELLAHIERSHSNPADAIDAIRVLAFIGDPETGNRMMALAASSKNEQIACELYKRGRLAAGGPPLDAKELLSLANSAAKDAVLPDLIRAAAKDEQVRAHLLERLESGELKNLPALVGRHDRELLTVLALDQIERLQSQPEKAIEYIKSLTAVANPEMGNAIFEVASRIQNLEVASTLYGYAKLVSGGKPDTATLIALSESGAKMAAIPDLIRQSLRDPEAKAYLEKCLKQGDFTDPTKFDRDESLAILGELMRESNLEDQAALFADIMEQLADKPELKSDFLVSAALDDGVETSLRQRAAQELEDFADERFAATVVSGGKGLSGSEVDELVNQYSKGEGNVSHQTMADALREYGIREMKRLGFGDKAIELMGPKYFGPENFDGKSLGGYDPKTGQIGIAVGRKLIEKLQGQMIHASSTTTHELRHRLNTFERTALSIVNPKEFRNALVEDVVQHIGQGGHRAEPNNTFFGRFSDFMNGKQTSVNAERLNATPEEVKFMREAVRKYLTEPADGSFGKPISEKSLAQWIEKNGLKIPEGSDSGRLLKEIVGEISHANLVKEKSVLPPELVKSDPVLKKCLEERVKMYGNSEDTAEARIRKLVRGVSDDIGALVTRTESEIDRVKDAHYLFSIEEVRARRTQHAVEIDQVMSEVKSLIRNSSEAKDLLRAAVPPVAVPSEILRLGDSKAMAQYLSKLKESNPDLAKAIEQVRDRPKLTPAEIRSSFEEMVTLINSGPKDLKEMIVDRKARDPLESQMKQLLADHNALSAFLAKMRQTDAARAEAIEKRLAAMDQIGEKIQFNNAIEQFHIELKNLRSFDDPHLAQDVAARMVVENIGGKNLQVADRPELAQARLNASIEKLLQTAGPDDMDRVLSQLQEKGISAEQIMQSVPASKAGEVAAYLHQRDPAKCNLKEILKMTSPDKLESVVVELITKTDLEIYHFVENVAREDLHRLTAILAKQPNFNLGTLTQIMIANNRLDDFLQTSLNEGVLKPSQIEALVDERRKSGASLLETEKIAGMLKAWQSSRPGP